MFYHQKNFVCDQRPVFECRKNTIVWHRRRWRVGSRQPGSLGVAGQTNDLVADALPHWKAMQLAKHRWDVGHTWWDLVIVTLRWLIKSQRMSTQRFRCGSLMSGERPEHMSAIRRSVCTTVAGVSYTMSSPCHARKQPSVVLYSMCRDCAGR